MPECTCGLGQDEDGDARYSSGETGKDPRQSYHPPGLGRRDPAGVVKRSADSHVSVGKDKDEGEDGRCGGHGRQESAYPVNSYRNNISIQ